MGTILVMHKKLNISIVFFLAGVFIYAQSAPLWYTDKDLEYPARNYISAVGEGRTRQDAEAAAITAISMFFDTRTNIRNEAIREFNETVTNNTTAFSNKTYIQESAVISSEVDFLGVRFTTPYQIGNTGRWAILAYIDRREAAGIYESKINSNVISINALVRDAENENESFYSSALLARAIPIGVITEELIRIAVTVDPNTREKYSAISVQIANLKTRYRAIRDSLTFGIQMTGVNSSGRIEHTLQELLEKNGFIISTRNPMYQVNIRLRMNEEQGTTLYSVQPILTITIERAGRTLFSYSKNYQRSSHSNANGAMNRALIAVEQDLEENFITQLTASIGR